MLLSHFHQTELGPPFPRPRFVSYKEQHSKTEPDMDLILLPEPLYLGNHRPTAFPAYRSFSYQVPCLLLSPPGRRLVSVSTDRFSGLRRSLALAASGTLMANSPRSGVYTVGDFMTRKEDLHVVKPTTTVDEALEALVENRITGFPVIDEEWKLVGLVSDYDLLALDSISGAVQNDASMFPEVDSTWKIAQPSNAISAYLLQTFNEVQKLTFNEVQKLLSKTNGKLVGDLMTPAPLVVRETTNLEDAARLLLETKYRRLPVVDAEGKLVGIITRGNVVRAALQIKRSGEMKA